MRTTLSTVLIGAVLGIANLACAHPCPSPPCADAEDCAAKSDWVVEGTLQSVIPGETHVLCEPGGPPQFALCGGVTDVPRLVLKDVVVVSGDSPLFRKHPVEIKRSYNCLVGTIRTVTGQSSTNIDSHFLGQRLRFIGTNISRSPLFLPGYMVVEILPPQ